MTFFSEVAPLVDWAKRTVIVRRGQQLLRLPVVKYNAKGVHAVQKTCASTAARSNPFGVLSIDDVGDDDDVDVQYSDVHAVGKQPSGSTQHTGNLVAAQPTVHQSKHVLKQHKTCIQCGKKYKATRVADRCFKCDNGSFGHIQNQLVDVDGDVSASFRDTLRNASGQVVHTSGGSVPAEGQCNAAAHSPLTGKGSGADVAEIVPLKQFISGGKHNQYLTYGVIMPDRGADDVSLTTADVLAALSADQLLLAESFGGVSQLLQQFRLGTLPCVLRDGVEQDNPFAKIF